MTAVTGPEVSVEARALLAVYAGYDDAALAALANPGLLRRARKELAAGGVTVVEGSGKGVTLAVGTNQVRLDARGPAGVTCSCPTAGACQHVVTASLWARDAASTPSVPAPGGALQDGADAAESAASPDSGSRTGPDPLAELLALDPDAVHRQVGAAAVRRVAERLASSAVECQVRIDGARAVVTWAGSPPVTYVAGAGVPGMVVGRAQSGAGAAELRLEAVVRVAARHGRTWRFPARSSAATDTSDAERDAVAAEVRSTIEGLLDVGLSHLGPDDVETLRAVTVRARLAKDRPLHRLLTACAAAVDGLAARDEGVDESAALTACAEVWAFVASDRNVDADDQASPSDPDDSSMLDAARLVPLGAWWWRTRGGSRGASLVVWDCAAGRARSVTTGRAAGTDPAFQRSWDRPLFWGRSLGALAAGPFTVRGADLKPGGDLGAGGSVVVTPLGAFDLDELREIADLTAAPTHAADLVGFGRRPARTRTVLVRQTGDVGVDEVRQQLTWQIVDAEGTPRTLRVPVDDQRSSDAVLGLVARRVRVAAVTIQSMPGHPDGEPVGFFVRDRGGALGLVSPSLTPIARDVERTLGWRRIQARVEALRSRAGVQSVAVAPPAPVEQVCSLLGDVGLAAAATGRRRLTTRQEEEVRQAGRIASDLGLVTLERVAADLGGLLDAATVLRSAFVVGRARAVLHQVGTGE